MALQGKDDIAKLEDLSGRTYKEQSVWVLNSNCPELEQHAEKFWTQTKKFGELDLEKGYEGNGVDELQAHRFLEHFQETLTVKDMREKLRKMGALAEGARPKYFPITHYYIFRYNLDFHHIVNAPQSANTEELAHAQELLTSAQNACRAAEQRAEEARKSEQAAKAAHKELERALAALHQEEEAYKKETDRLTKASEEGGVVTRNKAKNELAQHLEKDPLPLRRAKLNTEAAKKKAERAAAEAEAARLAADQALENAKKSLQEAEDYLKKIRASASAGQGTMWWMQRELDEARSYLPQSKQGKK